MRALLLAVLLTVTVLAGCVSTDDPGPKDLPAFSIPPLDVASIEVPQGATLVETATGAALEWVDVRLPFEETITVPAGAVQISVEGVVGDTQAVSTYLKNTETGRRRCNPDVVDTAWNVPYRGAHRCSGLALIDPPGTNWTVTTVTNVVDLVAKTVRVSFEHVPLDGVMAGIDFSRLSMPVHAVKPTEGFFVPSFDGTQLWTEVTLPEGAGPWPTVIAASPYNGQFGRIGQPAGKPAMWEYFTHDWAKRGYAVVNVDVRGFGLSGGCVEIWSENEQRDQAFIVDWVAAQDWSDGKVGFYGQSYVGTTPTAAAVYAPEALKAIIAVAPVINAYEDWHYGGVPNGENTLSPVAYQVLTDTLGTNSPDPVEIPTNAAKGICDATLVARANDPRAIYDAFYEERDFKKRAKDITAAVLYTEGFEDSNVKSAMIPGWFNDIDAPKLGVFGHWVHQHPTRADEEVLFLGWMDQWVKGLDLGLDELPAAIVNTNVWSERYDSAWPPVNATETMLWPDYAGGAFKADETGASGADLTISPAGSAIPTGDGLLSVAYELQEDLAVAGTMHLEVRGTLYPGGNAFLGATIYDEHDGKRDLVTYGMYNLAHNEDHTAWSPVTGAKAVSMPFLPTEYVFQAGHRLVVDLYGVADDPTLAPGIGLPAGRFALGEHPDGVGPLVLPTMPLDAYHVMPRTAEP